MSETASTQDSMPAKGAPRLRELEVRHVAMPLKEPWRVSVSEEAEIETVLVCLRAEDGEAWAEAAPHVLPQYCPDWAGASAALLPKIAPLVFTQELDDVAELQRRLGMFRGNMFAKACLDMAWWTLAAKRAGQPLHRMLGATRDFAEGGIAFGVLESHELLCDRIEAAIDLGYRRAKLKVRPGWDVSMLEAVRARFPDFAFHVDCNGIYTLADIDVLLALDRFDLKMIEQPLWHDDLIDHARLQERLQTPVCLDESILSPRHARHAIELGSCRAINVKLGRVGGVTPALEIIELCREAEMTAWVGSNVESSLGQAAGLAAACVEGCNYPADIVPVTKFVNDLTPPGLRISVDPVHGRIAHAEDVPGLAQTPDPELLDAQTVQRYTVTFA